MGKKVSELGTSGKVGTMQCHRQLIHCHGTDDREGRRNSCLRIENGEGEIE